MEATETFKGVCIDCGKECFKTSLRCRKCGLEWQKKHNQICLTAPRQLTVTWLPTRGKGLERV